MLLSASFALCISTVLSCMGLWHHGFGSVLGTLTGNGVRAAPDDDQGHGGSARVGMKRFEPDISLNGAWLKPYQSVRFQPCFYRNGGG
ncbi:hypothetical protein H4S14_002589 [Agrobacterium vitis]|nr:hypothetical protein [Agrobacterium vitis]MBE1438833.1 hypothetical protein [Agrobacterium vitis]